MIKKLVHFSDLHLRLFKDHDLYRRILTDMFEQFKEIKLTIIQYQFSSLDP